MKMMQNQCFAIGHRMLDYGQKRIITLGELTPEWWI